MNTYKDLLKEREDKENKLLKNSEALLEGSFFTDGFDSHDRMHGLEDCLNHIIVSFGLVDNSKGKATNIEELMEKMLSPLGIMYSQINDMDKVLKSHNSNRRYLAETENSEFIVIKNSVVGKVYYSPNTGKELRLSKKIHLKNTGYEICKPISNDHVGIIGITQYVISSVNPAKIVSLILFGIALSVLGLVAPSITSSVLNNLNVFESDTYSILNVLCIMFITAGVASAIIAMYKNVGMNMIQNDCSKEFQSAIMMQILKKPLSFFMDNGSGRITAYIMNARKLGIFISNFLLGVSISTFFSLIYIQQMSTYAASLVAPAVIILLLLIVLTIYSAVMNAENEANKIETDAELKDMIYTTINGIQKIRVAGAWKRAFNRWAKLYSKTLQYQYDPSLITKLKSLITVLIPLIGDGIILFIAIFTNVPASDYVSFTVSYNLIMAAVVQLCSMINSMSTIKPAYEQLLPILNESETIGGDEYVSKVQGYVQFENVSYAHKGINAFKLNNVSFEIKKGEKVGIVGESGSGKSTLMGLLTGIYKNDSGNILIDKKNINTLNIQSVCKHIGYVSQFGKLFPGTIRYNVSLGNDNISDDEIWKALDLAAIGDYIRNLPEGLDTNVSESSGGGFSGGQRQCIMIARAFIRKPGLLILDEATSALDNNTQKAVLENVEKMKCTIIMVAHRLSTIKNCDKIIVMEHGQIVESGTYSELMEANGKFRELVRRQEA